MNQFYCGYTWGNISADSNLHRSQEPLKLHVTRRDPIADEGSALKNGKFFFGSYENKT